jgi:hypothetical protein
VVGLDNSGYGLDRLGFIVPNLSSLYHIQRNQFANIKRGEKAKLETTTATTNSLTQSALSNLEETESEIETSTTYFKPKPDKTYVIKIDPQNKIEKVETDRFKDAQGKPVTRYQIKIAHVNNGKDQLWDTSKTVCTQIIAELKKGFTVLKATRYGSDRSTTYTIEGVQ